MEVKWGWHKLHHIHISRLNTHLSKLNWRRSWSTFNLDFLLFRSSSRMSKQKYVYKTKWTKWKKQRKSWGDKLRQPATATAVQMVEVCRQFWTWSFGIYSHFKAGQSSLELHLLCASPRPLIYSRGARASSVTGFRFSCRGRRLLSVVLILLRLTFVDAPFPTECRATEDLSGSDGPPLAKRRSTRWRRPSGASVPCLTPTASATPSVTQGQWGCFSNTGSFSVFVWPLCFRLYITFISVWSGTEKASNRKQTFQSPGRCTPASIVCFLLLTCHEPLALKS